MAKRERRETQGGEALSANPFASLSPEGLPQAPSSPTAAAPDPKPAKARSRGRLDVRRETSGRGGKTVTVVTGFLGISGEEKAALAKSIQKRCGVGGAVKDGAIEIQGDKREETRAVLEAAGFRVVFAGG